MAPFRLAAAVIATALAFIGWNAHEGAIFLAHTRLTPASYDRVLERSFPALFVHLLAPSPGNSDRSARAAAVAFSTDIRFRWDMWQWALLASSHEHDRVYMYEFTRTPPYPVSSPYYGLGATHGVEMQYVFDHPDPHRIDWTAADNRLAAALPAYWTRFARSGDPNGTDLPHWPQFTPTQPRVLRLGAEIVAAPITGLAPLGRISRLYCAATFVTDHWLWLMILAVVATAALLLAGARLIRRRPAAPR